MGAYIYWMGHNFLGDKFPYPPEFAPGVQIRFLHWGYDRSNFTKICNLTSLGV